MVIFLNKLNSEIIIKWTSQNKMVFILDIYKVAQLTYPIFSSNVIKPTILNI